MFVRYHSDRPVGLVAGLRRDLNTNPLVLYAGNFGKAISSLTEVYQGDLPTSEDHWIHNILKIPSTNPSLNHYLGETGSREINEHLRDNWLHETPIPDNIKYHIEKIDSIFHDVKEINKPLKLYTGLSESPVTTAGFEWNSTRSKKLIHLPAFTSSSTSPTKSVEFATVDNHSIHHESDHHGVITPGSRHLIQMEFDHRIHGAASVLDHARNSHEKEVLLGRGHEFILHPRPTLVHGYNHPVYVWRATEGIRTPIKKQL
jgi:hypothetical protein